MLRGPVCPYSASLVIWYGAVAHCVSSTGSNVWATAQDPYHDSGVMFTYVVLVNSVT